MSLLYADTSALVRAYFGDEEGHEVLKERLLDGDEPVVTSELSRVEFAGVVRGAEASGRFDRPRELLARFETDCLDDGQIGLIGLHPESVIPTAYRLVLEHRLRTLDALHLAVALDECPAIAGDEEIVFVTRDLDQAAAAEALGLTVG